MTDYGHELEFGYFLVPEAGDPYAVLEAARHTDRLGYDLSAVQDHPYQPAHLDTLAMLGVILAQTDHIRVFQDVGNLPLRPPAALAKAAATLDLLSGGRFEAGLGAGGFLDAAQAMGAPARTPGQSLEALEEAIVILCAWWSTTGVLRFHGRHYVLEGARPGPKPGAPDRDLARCRQAARARAHRAKGRRLGRPADELSASDRSCRGAGGDRRAARAAGRDPREIRRIYNVPGVFTTRAPAPARDTDKSIVGPPEHWAAVLTHLALDFGFGSFVLIAPPDPDVLRAFIEDVAPDVRARVAAARSQAEPAAAMAAASSR